MHTHAQHTIHREHGHHGWNNAFPPRLSIAPGETGQFETRDPSCGQLTPSSTTADVPKLDFSLVNPVTGPVFVDGAKPGDALEYRLMRAIEGGRDAGGQGTPDAHRPERSAAIKVVDRRDFPDVDVRVDVHLTAVAELRRVLEEFKLYEDFYRGRDSDPSKAIPQDVFAKELETKRRVSA